jgi:nucleotide-binding universal stress UspA family protein
MTGVVAVVGSTPPSLTETGAAVARLLRAELRHVWPGERPESAECLRAVLAELEGPDVLIAVLPGGSKLEAATGHVISSSSKPVVVTPHRPDTARPPAVSRVLLPLDGSWEAASAVAPTAKLLADAGVDLVVLHVFDRVTAPRFWDQAAHARSCWETEFRARYCPQPGVRLQLRTGAPAEQVLSVAAQEDVDLIVLGWSQRLEPNRAATVRRAVSEGQVPVMLMPVSTDPDRSRLRRDAASTDGRRSVRRSAPTAAASRRGSLTVPLLS